MAAACDSVLRTSMEGLQLLVAQRVEVCSVWARSAGFSWSQGVCGGLHSKEWGTEMVFVQCLGVFHEYGGWEGNSLTKVGTLELWTHTTKFLL
jgi:hypothetical protein